MNRKRRMYLAGRILAKEHKLLTDEIREFDSPGNTLISLFNDGKFVYKEKISKEHIEALQVYYKVEFCVYMTYRKKLFSKYYSIELIHKDDMEQEW